MASFDIAVGPPRRFIVGLLTADQRLVGHGNVEVRFSYLGTKDAPAPAAPGPVRSASYLPVPGSAVTAPAPATPQLVRSSDTRGVYAVEAGFDRAGFWQVEVKATIDGEARAGTGAFTVNQVNAVPAPGEEALATENLTLTTPDAPRAAIDSRAGSGDIPNPELHTTTIAAGLAAKRPIVAVFATPVYCTSRFCGPVTELVVELARDYGDRASFIHIEIWRDFQNKVLNRAAADWLLRNDNLSEPWVFVIGADGRIVARFDNVATRQEIEPLLRNLPVIGTLSG